MGFKRLDRLVRRVLSRVRVDDLSSDRRIDPGKGQRAQLEEFAGGSVHPAERKTADAGAPARVEGGKPGDQVNPGPVAVMPSASRDRRTALIALPRAEDSPPSVVRRSMLVTDCHGAHAANSAI